MAVEKALVEEREGFFNGGQSRRGGLRGGRRSSRRSSPGPKNRGRGGPKRSSSPGPKNRGRGGPKKSSPQGQTRRGTTTTTKDVEKKTREINRDFDSRTAFKTSSGDFLRDSKGNIVRSKTQVDRFKDDKRKQDIARKLGIDTTLGAAAANPNLRSQQMTPGEFRLSGRLGDFKKSLGRGVQTPENLRRLVDINRQLGDFDYAGMGLGNQFRTQGADLVEGVPGLAKFAGAVAGGPAGLASLVASGGRGITGLIADRLGFGKGDEDSRPTMADVSNQQPESGLQSLFAKLRIGEGAPFVEDRGGRQDDRSPPPTTDSFFGKTIKKLPITTQPVDTNIMNQYLALAGFSPQEIQGMPSAFRFLG